MLGLEGAVVYFAAKYPEPLHAPQNTIRIATVWWCYFLDDRSAMGSAHQKSRFIRNTMNIMEVLFRVNPVWSVSFSITWWA